MTAPARVQAWIDSHPEEQQSELEAIVAAFGSGPHVAYRKNPIRWAEDKLGIPEHTLHWSLNPGYATHEWDGTPDPLIAVAKALVDWMDVGVESGTATGKSFLAAVIILWFLASWEDARSFTFAPKEPQLRLYIWTEIRKLWPRFQVHFPNAVLTDLCIRMRGGMDDSWGAWGYAVGVGADEESATKAQGMHAEHMLLVYEETPGIHHAVIEAGYNTSTADHNLRLALGNPTSQQDTLHRFCEGTGVVAVRISALDHPNVVTGNPNVIPGAVTKKKVDLRREEYGETDPLYKSRVRGLSPEQASNALIKRDWLIAAHQRWLARKEAGELPTRVTGKGVDAANSEHGDRACIVDFCDNVWLKPRAFPCPDANVLGSQIVREAQSVGLPNHRVGVDAIGVGAGTVNEARRLRFVVQPLYAGGQPMRMAEKLADGTRLEWSPDVNLFKNLRAQMYWQAREDLRKGVIDGPEDKELWEELTAPTFEDHDKVVIIEPKDDIRQRIGRSPDKADAFVMANWVRKRTVEPKTTEKQQGQTAGYDYQGRKPREKMTADQEFQQIMDRARPSQDATFFGSFHPL